MLVRFPSRNQNNISFYKYTARVSHREWVCITGKSLDIFLKNMLGEQTALLIKQHWFRIKYSSAGLMFEHLLSRQTITGNGLLHMY